VLVFVVGLGAAAYALNNAVNPPQATSTPATQHACPPAPAGRPAKNPKRTFDQAPAMSIDPSRSYAAQMCTDKGLITIQLLPGDAPLTVNNFVFLAQQGFYDGLTFHRVCPNVADQTCGGNIHIAQGGDPEGTGRGGPGYQFNDEPPKGTYDAGTIAMANSGANTNGSQFFINTDDNARNFSPNYNLFGHIVSGIDVARSLGKGDHMRWVVIKSSLGVIPSPAETPSPVPAPSPS
jgi:peptidylprolyl isomerase/peptidyl-prolyl cis-trans isomerase B (cyclophilin B)